MARIDNDAQTSPSVDIEITNNARLAVKKGPVNTEQEETDIM